MDFRCTQPNDNRGVEVDEVAFAAHHDRSLGGVGEAPGDVVNAAMLVFCANLRNGAPVASGAAHEEGALPSVLVDARQKCVDVSLFKGLHVAGFSCDGKQFIAKPHPVDDVTDFGGGVGVGSGFFEMLAIAHAAENVGLVFDQQAVKSLGGVQILRVAADPVKLADAVEAGHHFVSLGAPAILLLVPVEGRGVGLGVGDQVGALVVLALPFLDDIQGKIVIFVIPCQAVKDKHGLEDGAGGHTVHDAGVLDADAHGRQLVDKLGSKPFAAGKNVRVIQKLGTFDQSPEGIFPSPDVPVPVHAVLGFVHAEDVAAVPVGGEVAVGALELQQVVSGTADVLFQALVPFVAADPAGAENQLAPEFAPPVTVSQLVVVLVAKAFHGLAENFVDGESAADPLVDEAVKADARLIEQRHVAQIGGVVFIVDFVRNFVLHHVAPSNGFYIIIHDAAGNCNRISKFMSGIVKFQKKLKNSVFF